MSHFCFDAHLCSETFSITKNKEGKWVIVDPKLLSSYEVSDEIGSKAGHMMLLGPYMAKRSLDIDETYVQEWIDTNKDILHAMRAATVNKRHPKMILVLSEWTTNTWAHISWIRKEDRPHLLHLIQQSPQSAPQWNAYNNGSMTQMTCTGNRMVSIGM